MSDNSVSITGLAIRNRKVDISQQYLDELVSFLDDAMQLSKDGDFKGPYIGLDQLEGKIMYVSWVNNVHKKPLLEKFNRIDQGAYLKNSMSRGLVIRRKMLVRKTGTLKPKAP